jgi:hypothetical protein
MAALSRYEDLSAASGITNGGEWRCIQFYHRLLYGTSHGNDSDERQYIQ